MNEQQVSGRLHEWLNGGIVSESFRKALMHPSLATRNFR
jgi:hypothetical protein